MKCVNDLMGWISHDGAPWRPYPREIAGPVKPAHRPHALIALSRVSGAPILDRDGRLSGRIDDLSIEKATGRVIYALVAFRSFLGLRSRIHPLPWSLLRYDPDRESYMIPVRTADIADAPSLTPDELEFFGAGDRAWRERLAAYYSPYLNMPAI